MSVTNDDLTALMNILYQGTVRKNGLAVTPVISNPARFFLVSDIPTLATDYDLPLPTASVADTLKLGLSRGVYQRSIQRGTQCGRIPGASPCETSTNQPVLIYAYNPNMAKVNTANQALLNPFILNYQKIAGSSVKFQDNHTVGYGTRGYFSTSNYFGGANCMF
jgi:hypothetical protein